MSVEQIVFNYLTAALNVPVFMSEPEKPPARYVLVEKTAGSRRNHIKGAVVAVQSFGSSLLDTVSINEMVKEAMYLLPSRGDVSRCELNSDYNYTDPQTRRHRYQAVFDIVYFG